MPTLAARVKDALSTADEIGVDPVRFFLELLLQIGGANIALFDCSLRSLRRSLDCRRLRRN
jgi:hypothetical protein